MRVASHNYAYADRMLTLAVAAMCAQRTAHEGLLVAEQRYVRWLDIDTDLPAHLRPRVRDWRARLSGATDPSNDHQNLLNGLRALPTETAQQHALALIKIADELENDAEFA